MHPDLPAFYKNKINYHLIERYYDYENRDDEIVADINHKLDERHVHDHAAPHADVKFEKDKSSDDEDIS